MGKLEQENSKLHQNLTKRTWGSEEYRNMNTKKKKKGNSEICVYSLYLFRHYLSTSIRGIKVTVEHRRKECWMCGSTLWSVVLCCPAVMLSQGPWADCASSKAHLDAQCEPFCTGKQLIPNNSMAVHRHPQTLWLWHSCCCLCSQMTRKGCDPRVSIAIF